MATPPNSAEPGARAPQTRISLGPMLRSGSRTSTLILSVTLLLVLIGLIMVLSSSSVISYLDEQGFLGMFAKQAVFAAIGLPLMLIASTRKVAFWKKWAWPLLGFGVMLQLLVFSPIGIDVYGNRNWIQVGGVTMQPSEPLKLALIVWMGTVLYQKRKLLGNVAHALIPVLPGAVLVLGTVLLGHDLGTVIIMAAIVIGVLFFAGLSWKALSIPLVGGIVMAAGFALFSENRMGRILNFLEKEVTDYSGRDWQPLHGEWALASGGLFGVGLGNSRTKWSWLPAADNDYIFAIIGEETGMVGALVVIGLYVVLAFALLRAIRECDDLFGRAVIGGVFVWIIGQAFVNIAVVLKLLPVLGVPLPLLSSGGTALISCMLAIGVVLSITRDTAERRARAAEAAVADLHAGPTHLGRTP